MAITQLPAAFCWSKMGTESGEDLSSIIRRKEWERQLGDGIFLWGIGQSLGANAALASPTGDPLAVVFSPMPSKPKSIDLTPDEVVLWDSWVDAHGQVLPLPSHSFVTSRAHLPSGRRKESHYALVCSSGSALTESVPLRVSPSTLKNFGTGRALGSSQVTAVVAHDNQNLDESSGYAVSFVAQLQAPFFVRLAHPIVLGTRDIAKASDIGRSGSVRDWESFVTRLRHSVKKRAAPVSSEDMFKRPTPFKDTSPVQKLLFA